MNRNILIEILSTLAYHRPVFYSEADFQHELAMTLRSWGYKVRLERPFMVTINNNLVRCELDILATDPKDGLRYAIELKYFKKKFKTTVQQEVFDLPESWLPNLSRFDAWADYARVGAIVTEGHADVGFSLTLTNASTAWSVDTANGNTYARYLSLHEGRAVNQGDQLDWNGNPGLNAVTARRLAPYAPIVIPANAQCQWCNYSKPNGNPPKNRLFRYLLLATPASKKEGTSTRAVSAKRTVSPKKPTSSGNELAGATDGLIQLLHTALKEQEYEAAGAYKSEALSSIGKMLVSIPGMVDSVKGLLEKNIPARKTIFLEEGPINFLRIVDACGNTRNDGLICLHEKHTNIALKNQGGSPRYLIGEIAAAGGHFTDEALGYSPCANGLTCVGGTNYQGQRVFGSLGQAIKYLRQYFIVRGCKSNQTWTDERIFGRPMPPVPPMPPGVPKHVPHTKPSPLLLLLGR